MSLLARVHSIESCGTLDGPGIRYILFLQGCLMRCLYCHNRDTWDLNTGDLKSVDDLMPEILSYRHYMKGSGGGVTCSGGEPLLQIPFLVELFERLKSHGIHTCLDTNGYVRQYDASLDRLLASTDLVMLDLKAIDDEVHKPLTKISNRYALDFARHLVAQQKKIWVRYVVVPGFTDTDEGARLLGQFIQQDLQGQVQKVDLLPYHELGSHKWANYGDQFALVGVKPPPRARLDAIADILRSYQVEVGPY